MSDSWEPDCAVVESPERGSVSAENLEHEAVIGRTPTTVVHRVGVENRDRPVAVKHPATHGTLGADVFDSFRGEGRRWLQLAEHPHIVGVVDWDETPLPWLHHPADVPWIAMEYMDGGDLSGYQKELSIDGQLWVAERLADAVWFAHHHGGGLIHHDLKPENILFRETPGDQWDVPKIADWELAQTTLDQSDSVGVTTPRYTAPEQTRSASTDRPTDQFQFGIVMYELFTGAHPFVNDPESKTERAVVDGIMQNEATPPGEHQSDLPPALDDLLLAMLKKDPTDRYEAMLQVRNDLQAIRDRATNSRSRRSGSERQSGSRRDSDSKSEHGDAGTQAAESASSPRGSNSNTQTEWTGIGVGAGVVIHVSDRGAVEVETDLANDGIFYLSDIDRELEVGQRVSLYYEGDDPGAGDVVEIQPAKSDEVPPKVDKAERFGEGVVIETTGDSTAAIETPLANDGVFYLSDLEANLRVGDNVILQHEGANPTATDVTRVVPRDDFEQTVDNGEGPETRNERATSSGGMSAGDRPLRGSWPRAGYDRGRTSHTPDQAGPDGSVGSLWESRIASGLESGPVVADGTVYAGTTDGQLFALDARAGVQRWQFQTDNDIVATPVVAGETLYAVSKDAHVYAIDRNDGTKRWASDTGSGIYAPPIITKDRVVVTSRSGVVAAIHTGTGEELWNVETTPGIRIPATQFGRRRLLVGDDNGVLHVLTKDGSERATIDVSGYGRIRTPIIAPANSSMVLVGDTLVDIQRETVVDTFDRGVRSVPAVAAGTAYYVTGDEVRGIETYSGEQTVSYSFDGGTGRLGTETTPSVADGTVYTGLGDGTIVALNAETGREKWRQGVDSTVVGSPAVLDGHLFAATSDGTLYAFARHS